MDLESVTLKLPRDLLSGAQRVATARDVTIGHLVRQLLKREVDRQLSAGTREGTDVRLLAALQALLARDMAEARDWEDLAVRLRPHGYDLRPSGGGVALYKSSCGTRVCKGSEIGFSYGALVKRYGAPMPDHPHKMTHLGVMPSGRIDPTRHAMLCGHIDAARGWADLINRLAIEGMELRAIGAGLGIYASATGRHLCNSAAVGARYQTLVKRYGAPLPGHPHDVSAHLGGVSNAPEEEEIELIEREGRRA
jgi:hypothetical protein